MNRPGTIDGAPTIPAPPEAPLARGDVVLRFEDVAQDGRILVAPLLTGLGVTWGLLSREPYTAKLLGAGVLPILTRIVAEGTAGPFGIASAMQVRGTYALLHGLGAGGDVERIHLSMWVEASIPIGVTYGAPPPDAGRLAVAGRVYAEHTFTRPFAAPGERRVTRLDAPGVDPVPGRAIAYVAARDAARAPEGARFDDFAPDACPFVFGVGHTDSNRHVNSLVYARLFEEAALRRLAEQDRAAGRAVVPRLVRRVQLGYKKPSFAGDTVRAVLRLFEHDGVIGAVGGFVPEDAIASAAGGDPLAQARAFVACTIE